MGDSLPAATKDAGVALVPDLPVLAIQKFTIEQVAFGKVPVKQLDGLGLILLVCPDCGRHERPTGFPGLLRVSDKDRLGAGGLFEGWGFLGWGLDFMGDSPFC